MHAAERGGEGDERRAGRGGVVALQQLGERLALAQVLHHDQAGRPIAGQEARRDRLVLGDLAQELQAGPFIEEPPGGRRESRGAWVVWLAPRGRRPLDDDAGRQAGRAGDDPEADDVRAVAAREVGGRRQTHGRAQRPKSAGAPRPCARQPWRV